MSASFGPMPDLLIELIEIVGLETALTIADNYGGVRVDIPHQARTDHWLTDLVGMSDASKICEYFRTLSPDGRRRGTHHIVIPKGPTTQFAKLHAKFVRLRERGLSVREASRRLGFTERTGFRLNAKSRRTHNSRQSSLF